LGWYMTFRRGANLVTVSDSVHLLRRPSHRPMPAGTLQVCSTPSQFRNGQRRDDGAEMSCSGIVGSTSQKSNLKFRANECTADKGITCTGAYRKSTMPDTLPSYGPVPPDRRSQVATPPKTKLQKLQENELHIEE